MAREISRDGEAPGGWQQRGAVPSRPEAQKSCSWDQRQQRSGLPGRSHGPWWTQPPAALQEGQGAPLTL